MCDKAFLAEEIERIRLDIALAVKRRMPEFAVQLEARVAELQSELRSQQRVLACHSKGDKRFSALVAVVDVLGVRASIETHYQTAKRFVGKEPPTTWRDGKGRRADWFEIAGRRFPVELLPQFYTLLWVKYLDAHPELVEYADSFDDYEDIFTASGHVSQADCIRKYCQKGRAALLAECQEFIRALKETNNG